MSATKIVKASEMKRLATWGNVIYRRMDPFTNKPAGAGAWRKASAVQTARAPGYLIVTLAQPDPYGEKDASLHTSDKVEIVEVMS